MQQIHEEYLKEAQGQSEQQGTQASSPQKGFIPLTPQEGQLKNIPKDVKEAMEELSQTTIVNAEGPPV